MHLCTISQVVWHPGVVKDYAADVRRTTTSAQHGNLCKWAFSTLSTSSQECYKLHFESFAVLLFFCWKLDITFTRSGQSTSLLLLDLQYNMQKDMCGILALYGSYQVNTTSSVTLIYVFIVKCRHNQRNFSRIPIPVRRQF